MRSDGIRKLKRTSDPEELAWRLEDLTNALARIRLKWSSSSLEFLIGAAAAPVPPPVLTSSRQEFHTVDTLRVLGVMVDSRGSTHTQLEFRLREANKVWGRTRHLLCDRSLAPALCVQRFYQTVGTSATYGCGMWAPTSTLFNSIEAQELRWLRAMTGVRKNPGEEWVPFYRRRRAAANRLRTLNGRWTLWHRVCRSVHGLHGHWARHPHVPAAVALGWRGSDWWRTQQDLHVSGLGTEDDWRHPSQNWTRAAGTLVTNFLGPEWRHTAQDRAVWKHTERSFVRWCCDRVATDPPSRRRPLGELTNETRRTRRRAR